MNDGNLIEAITTRKVAKQMMLEIKDTFENKLASEDDKLKLNSIIKKYVDRLKISDLDIKLTSKEKTFVGRNRRTSKKDACEYCNLQDEFSQYIDFSYLKLNNISLISYTHILDEDTKYPGELEIRVALEDYIDDEDDKEGELFSYHFKINYCPMCGRKLKVKK